MSRLTAVCYDAEGRITRIRSGNATTVQADLGDTPYVAATGSVSRSTHYVENGELHEIPPEPGPHHVFDYSSKSWVYSIELARDEKWSEMKMHRDAEEFGGLDFGGHRYDTDALSQQRIQGASQQVALGAFTSIKWTTADNLTVTLTAQEVDDLARAVGQLVNTAHERGRIVRLEIAAATTEAELEAITWPTS